MRIPNAENNDDKTPNFTAFTVSNQNDALETLNTSAFIVILDIKNILDSDENNVWLLDSGASRHISCHREWFTDFRPCENERVCRGDETTLEVKVAVKF